jgi:hypothetical protein
MQAVKQRTGISSASTAEIQSEHDADGKVKLKLTAELRRQIMLEKPGVSRAYLANVPHLMSDSEFWGRYFRMQMRAKVRPP